MTAVLYPRSLPCPQTSVVTPAERRALSDPQRPREARNVQRDRLEYERVTWPPFDPDKAEAIFVFWRDTLHRGGAWFTAEWPLPRGLRMQVVRKFREQPKWQFIPGGFWQLSALCEVRGRGKPIDDQVPPPLLDPTPVVEYTYGTGWHTTPAAACTAWSVGTWGGPGTLDMGPPFETWCHAHHGDGSDAGSTSQITRTTLTCPAGYTLNDDDMCEYTG
jgi:hypothetical protein